MKYCIKITVETESEERVIEIIDSVMKITPYEQRCNVDGREIATVNAKNKSEAIAALEMLLDTVRNKHYDEAINERVLVTNEGINIS